MLFKPEFYSLESKPPQVCITEGVSHPISFLAFVKSLIMPVWETVVPVSQAITQYCYYSTKDNGYFYYINIFHIQGVKYFFCEFHREQAWERWTSKSVNGVSIQKEEVLAKLRQVASSETEEIFKQRVNALKESNLWKGNSHLRNWFETTWLKEHKVSASRRQKMFIILTFL